MTLVKSAVWALALVALVALVAASGCCCCCSSDVLPTATFTAGDFPHVPPYPGAEQRTADSGAYGLATLPFQLLAEDAEWKQYVVQEDSETIIDWYNDQMTNEGWISATDMTEEPLPVQGGLFFARVDDPQEMAVIMVLPDSQEEGTQHILIGRFRLQLEEQ